MLEPLHGNFPQTALIEVDRGCWQHVNETSFTHCPALRWFNGDEAKDDDVAHITLTIRGFSELPGVNWVEAELADVALGLTSGSIRPGRLEKSESAPIVEMPEDGAVALGLGILISHLSFTRVLVHRAFRVRIPTIEVIPVQLTLRWIAVDQDVRALT